MANKLALNSHVSFVNSIHFDLLKAGVAAYRTGYEIAAENRAHVAAAQARARVIQAEAEARARSNTILAQARGQFKSFYICLWNTMYIIFLKFLSPTSREPGQGTGKSPTDNE
jgi:hypothetical protein